MRKHSRTAKLAAVLLARVAGADVAGASLGIDPRSIRTWMDADDAPPADDWQAVRDVLMALASEAAALGKTSGLPQLLTGAGIAERNLRYGALNRRHDAKRSARAEQAAYEEWEQAVDYIAARLPDAIRRPIADAFRIVADGGTPPDPLPLPDVSAPEESERRVAVLAYIESTADMLRELPDAVLVELQDECDAALGREPEPPAPPALTLADLRPPDPLPAPILAAPAPPSEPEPLPFDDVSELVDVDEPEEDDEPDDPTRTVRPVERADLLDSWRRSEPEWHSLNDPYDRPLR